MPITFDQETKRWFLETENMGYVFGLDDQGKIKNLYWGSKLPRFKDYPQVKDLIDVEIFGADTPGFIHGEEHHFPFFSLDSYIPPTNML